MDLAPLIFKVSIRQKSHPVRHLENPVKSMVSEEQKIAKKNKNRTSMDAVGISFLGNEKGEVTHLQEKKLWINSLPTLRQTVYPQGQEERKTINLR